MATFYLDPTAVSNGDGSIGSPFNTIENVLSGILTAFNSASEDYIVNCLTGADATSEGVIASIDSTSATPRVLRFIASDANRHTGVRNTGYRYANRFRVNTTNTNVTVELVGLNIREFYQDNAAAATTNIRSCFIPDSTGHPVQCGGGIVNVINCAVIGGAFSGPLAENNNGTATVNCINTTVANCGADGGFVARFGGTMTAVNCYSGGNSGSDYSGVTSPTNCLSEDGTQSTTTAAYSTANFTVVSAGTENLKLPSGSALIAAGVGPGSNGSVPSEDFEGTGRSGTTTDVGFDQRTASGGGGGQAPRSASFMRMLMNN